MDLKPLTFTDGADYAKNSAISCNSPACDWGQAIRDDTLKDPATRGTI